MVEVFKTNVTDPLEAEMLIDLMHQHFRDYSANFDLEDCDRILRVASQERSIDPASLIRFMEKYGYRIEALPDAPATGTPIFTDHSENVKY